MFELCHQSQLALPGLSPTWPLLRPQICRLVTGHWPLSTGDLNFKLNYIGMSTRRIKIGRSGQETAKK